MGKGLLVMAPQTTVFVVDDEQTITEFMTGCLSDAGYYVKAYHDGTSALHAIRSERPGLVLLDIDMPKIRGDDLLRVLRATGFINLPIIVVTAMLHTDHLVGQGATAIIHKPYELDVLLNAVAQHLQPPLREAP